MVFCVCFFMIGVEKDSAEVGTETNASNDVKVPVVKATWPQGRLVQFCLNYVLGA